MPSVPSHDRSFFREAIDRAAVSAHRSAPSSASIPFNSFSFIRQPLPWSSRLTSHSRFIPSGGIHLHTWCAGQTGPHVCATRRCL